MFKHSIASVSLPGILKDKLVAVAKAGYDGIELFENDLTVSNLSPNDFFKMAQDLGIEFVGLQPLRDFEAVPDDVFRTNINRAKYKLELASLLGAKRLFVCSNTAKYCINNLELAVEQLSILATLAETYGIQIGYEALSWGKYVNTYHRSVDIVNRANHPNLGHILDNYHIEVVGTPLDEIYKIDGSKITIAQIADAPIIEMSPIYLGRHYRCFPGQGSYPVVDYVKAIASTGYCGYLSHEIFSDDFRSSHLNDTAMDGKRSLVWVENMGLNLKKAINLLAIAYIEIPILNENSGLVSIFESLGMQKLRKGNTIIFKRDCVEIHLKINTKKSLSKVCFQVNSLKEIVDWSSLLNYPFDTITNTITANNDVIWGFEENQNAKIGDMFIDHIGHTVESDRFLPTILFYRTLLGLNLEDTVEIFDPNGIVQSRVVKNETIHISLNTTSNKNTSTNRFIKNNKCGIQQIAIGCQDIFETVKSIKNTDLILGVPANYYNDLESKSWLDIETIATMKKYNILFDRNEEGDFYHFYFKECDGVFVEVVQRTGQYARYGEVNAELRLAAQARDSVEK